MWSSAGLVLLVGAIAAFGQTEKPVPEAPRVIPMTTVNVENTLTTEERAQGWKLLFDGKTTAGWRGYKQKDMPAGWQVIDGALVRTRRGRRHRHDEQYDSFELALDWKIPEGGNSGVMYRVSEEGESTYHTGPEVQILDNHRHRDGKNPLTSAGSCYALYAPTKDVTRPIGSWNELRLVVKGNHVEHWLNGDKIVEYEINSPDWNTRVAGQQVQGVAEIRHLPPRSHRAAGTRQPR